MAKFIIEISDEYIREHADFENVKKSSEADGKNSNFLKAMFDTMAYSIIEKKINEGVAEFNISRELMEYDSCCLEYFDRNAGDICMMARMAMKDEKKDE